MEGRKNFDDELNNLIKEATQWKMNEANEKGGFIERDECLTAIANAITNYVTVEITRRLTVPSEPTPPLVSSFTSLSPRRFQSVTRPQSLCTTPSTPRKAISSTRINKNSQPTTPAEEYCTLKRGPQYHSENRLDRFTPAPRPNETPLENKASRLRRQSAERRYSYSYK